VEHDPGIHHRRSIRLRGYDYSQPGFYFVTICAHEKRHLFGEVVEWEMRPNDFGRAVESCWRGLAPKCPEAHLDAFVLMPNHVHGLIEILRHPVGAIHELPLRAPRRGMMLSKIVGRFKMVAAKRINEMRGTPGAPVWQRNYYEHVVRNDRELAMIRNYMLENPARWDADPENA
jgi:REP-associated tyrosine transposase